MKTLIALEKFDGSNGGAGEANKKPGVLNFFSSLWVEIHSVFAISRAAYPRALADGTAEVITSMIATSQVEKLFAFNPVKILIVTPATAHHANKPF